MPHHAKTFAAAALAAGLAALPTAPPATAPERITLEAIGAVRMARSEEIRRPSPEFRPAKGAQPRDPAAGRNAKAQ